MKFDYSKLNGRIVERFHTQAKFSEAMGVSERTLSLKLNGQRFFTQREIVKAIRLLDIRREDISDYFFAEKVQKIEPEGAA